MPTDSGRFDVRAAAAPFDLLGRWPVSGANEIDAAIDGCPTSSDEDAASSGPGSTAVALEAAARRLEANGSALLARRVGLREDELARDLRGLSAEVHDAIGRAHVSTRTGELALVLPDWSELLRGPLVDAAEELMRGRSVLLAADARAPMAVDEVASALLAAGIPSSHVAVVHGVAEEGIARAVGAGRVVSVRATGDRTQIKELRARCERAGVGEQRLRLLRAQSASVGPDDDPELRAQEIIAQAFDRVTTLSGQRHGQIGRVFCHARQFARFTAALLAGIEADESARDPLPAIDRAAFERIRREWEAGLDEGATLIAGGEALVGDADSGPAAGPRSRRVSPSVFTNVEPPMALLARQAPMPIVCLVRTFG